MKIVSPGELDFAALIRPGETVGWAQATAEPVFLTRILDGQAEHCPPFRLFFVLSFAEGYAGNHPNVTVTAFGGGAGGRRFFAGGGDRAIPANMSDLCALVEGGRPRVDIALLQVAGPDEAGRYNAGIGVEMLREAMAGARLVIAQQNDRMPWTEGDTTIEPDEIDMLVPASHPLVEYRTPPLGPVEEAIAGHVARLVPDRATIELGYGAIPEAVTRALGGKSGLGVHSGAVGDGVMRLMQAGVVDNRHKEIDPGVTVAMMLMGGAELYRFAERNPALHIRSPRYTHDALVLANFRRFVAINSALEVDLTGQCNAETASGRLIGLTGGQVDFVRAANRSPDGRSVIALQSTNRDRSKSRIVARIADGIVTTPRADADCVVTEHGIAELRGRTLAERAEALIAIADPAFRAELRLASERLL
ncbi:MAG TPA: acetyl-CoA hydrolase/transferase C-terminal domain-containing protein [Stellaceae bacterium]|nr:acetyl-CoA hydrolase/transferase C-terminal domain-containing protein [Stellaceae bacterium]